MPDTLVGGQSILAQVSRSARMWAPAGPTQAHAPHAIAPCHDSRSPCHCPVPLPHAMTHAATACLVPNTLGPATACPPCYCLPTSLGPATACPPCYCLPTSLGPATTCPPPWPQHPPRLVPLMCWPAPAGWQPGWCVPCAAGTGPACRPVGLCWPLVPPAAWGVPRRLGVHAAAPGGRGGSSSGLPGRPLQL